ncbi:MAG: hypothetical protein IJ706_07525 [Clostridia bacterium]|nr:hypothetical protein [Clostridia bacterium]
MELKGKKLLILGATTETIFLVKKAESLGVLTYVVDPYENAPAKKYSSNPINLNCFDIDGVLGIIENNKIDGVLPGCADVLVPVYEEVCRKAGKYCYINEEIVKVFGNKKGLKEMLIKHGLPVIEEFTYEEVISEGFNSYPIFLKPTDNNSSKGMTIVYDKSGFDVAYKKALENSRSKTVLIEKYKTCNDFFMGYLLQDGKVAVTFTADRFVNAEQKGVGTITAGMLYPSKYTDLYFNTIHKKMISIFEKLEFKNGLMHIQGFVENGKIMFYDPALRITGGQEYLLLEKIYGLDLLKCLINFALIGSVAEEDLTSICDCKFHGKIGCNLAFSVRAGKIGKIDGIEYAKKHKNVINVTQEHYDGALIDRIGTAQQNIARMHLIADSREEMRDAILDLQANVIAYDEAGCNMMLTGLNANDWYARK